MAQKNANTIGQSSTQRGSLKNHGPEITLDLLAALLLFFWPTAAEQMDLPHNFWVGLASAIIAFGVALRIFWILPWTRNFSRLEKSLIAFIAAGALALTLYGPVKAGYARKRAAAAPAQSTPAQPVLSEKAAPSSPPTATQPRARPRTQTPAPTPALPSVSQRGTGNNQTVVGGDVDQSSQGNCSPNIVGSGNTTNCNTLPPMLIATRQELKFLPNPAMPWAVEFMLNTTGPIQTGDLRLECSGPVTQAAVSRINASRFITGKNGPDQADPNTVVFELGPELLSPGQSVKVVVYSPAPVTVLSGTFGRNKINF